MAITKVTTEVITGGAVTTPKIADNAITAAKIPDGTIATGHIADNAVTAAKIPDNVLTATMLPDNVILATHIPNATDLTLGTVTAALTGNASGTAATVTTAAQPNITSLGTLTTLTVDNVIINGTTIGHTSDDDLITLADGLVTVAGEISVTTLDIGGTNITSTAVELNYVDGVTSAIQTQIDTKASTGKAIAMSMVFG